MRGVPRRSILRSSGPMHESPCEWAETPPLPLRCRAGMHSTLGGPPTALLTAQEITVCASWPTSLGALASDSGIALPVQDLPYPIKPLLVALTLSCRRCTLEWTCVDCMYNSAGPDTVLQWVCNMLFPPLQQHRCCTPSFEACMGTFCISPFNYTWMVS